MAILTQCLNCLHLMAVGTSWLPCGQLVFYTPPPHHRPKLQMLGVHAFEIIFNVSSAQSIYAFIVFCVGGSKVPPVPLVVI